MQSTHQRVGRFGGACVCLAFLALHALILFSPALGQEHVWSQKFGGTGYDYGFSVGIDGSGNIFVTGQFEDTVDFGGGPLTALGYYGDIFLAKYDADGNHIWSKRFGDSSPDYSYNVGIDASGNVLITGYFWGTINFGGSPLQAAMADIFVAKFDANGNHIWSKRFGGTNIDKGWCVDTDASGNIFITGNFREQITFGGGVYLTSTGNYDIFLVKLDPNGNHIWSQRFGGTEIDLGQYLSVDGNGDVLLTGLFRTNVDFGGGTITNSGGSDIFLAKYGSGGGHIWSKGFGSSMDDEGEAVCTDSEKNVIFSGNFHNTVNFGGGPLTSAGVRDIFLVTFDQNGNHLWSRSFGGIDLDHGECVATDGSNNVFLTGAFGFTADFGGGSLTSAGLYDVILAKYDQSGAHIWSRRYGGTKDDFGDGIAIDGLGDVVMTGMFASSSIDFGGGPLYNAGETDIFLTKHEGSVVWRGDVYIDKDVVVDAGQTLTVEPGTTVRVALTDADNKGSNPNKVEIIVHGEIDVNGTASEPVVFRSATPVGKTDWVGIYLDDTAAGGDFEYCTIKHAEYAVETWIPIAFDNCVIDSAAYAGVVVQAGQTTIDNSSITNGGCFGVFLGASTVTISGSAFEYNASVGVELNGLDTLYVYGSSFSNNGKGLALYNNAVAHIDNDCSFAENDIGALLYQSSNVWIKNSTFVDNTTGIYCNYFSDATIEGNAFTGNGKGIHCYDYSSPLIEWNSITYNTIGIYAATNSEPNIGCAGFSGHNSIHHNSAYHIVNATWEFMIWAEDNWWGSSNGPKPYKIIGWVDYDPWLMSAPLGASPYPGSTDEDDELPAAYKLTRVYPNPFNPMTTIEYAVTRPGGRVRIAVYNVTGQLVEVLVDEHRKPGNYVVEWNGRDHTGQLVASSIYFIKMEAGDFEQTQKAVLIR